MEEFNPVESEFNPSLDHIQFDMIEQLLKTATIAEEKKEYIYKTLDSLSHEEAHRMIEYLTEKQVNRIHAGLNYNATYIKEFIKKSI